MSDKLRPYSVTRGHSPFDWNTFLNKTFSEVTKEELDRTVWRAHNWVTCACGNQCALLPRRDSGSPMDVELRELGQLFFEHIHNMEASVRLGLSGTYDRSRNYARTVLEQIEKRSAYLLQEMGATTL